MNAFVDDQLQEEDEAARRFAEKNRQLVLEELRAQERHHERQKARKVEHDRVAAEQDEWCVRACARTRVRARVHQCVRTCVRARARACVHRTAAH